MLTLRLTRSLEQRLATLSQRTGRAKSAYAVQALEDRLPDFEKAAVLGANQNAERVRTAIRTLKRLRRGVTKPVGMTVRQMREAGRV